MDARSGERDFFISYRSADQPWAEWIAWELEAAGYTVFVQAWDFRPGQNFVHQMQQGASSCRRTIAVLTPAYVESGFTRAEWYSAFARDPTGEAGLLLPVRVEPCDIDGLLGQIIYLDLVGLEEARAGDQLLAGVKGERPKPSRPPMFPGSDRPAERPKPPFPASPVLVPTRCDPTTGGSLRERQADPAEPIPDNTVREKAGIVRKFWPLSRQKNTGIILAFLLIVIAPLALLLSGWNHPLRHFLSPSALRSRLDPQSPPPVGFPVNPQLKLYGNRKNNEDALYIEQKTSDRFAIDTGIELKTFNPTQEERFKVT